jgi:hypothetical protein
MKIHAHILAWNEEKILPFTLDYYSLICEKIFIYDNMSTDSSDEIYKKYEKVEVIKWDSGNEFRDDLNMKLKTEEYKKRSRGQNVDWVIVCDCDEFLYHPNLIEKLIDLKNRGIDIPEIDGRNMFSEEYPTYDGRLLPEIVKTGSEMYLDMCKNIIFNPDKDITVGVGGHFVLCNNCKRSEQRELKLLHYTYLGRKEVKQKYINRSKRLSDYNKKNRFGEHYYRLPYQYMDENLKANRIVV